MLTHDRTAALAPLKRQGSLISHSHAPSVVPCHSLSFEYKLEREAKTCGMSGIQCLLGVRTKEFVVVAGDQSDFLMGAIVLKQDGTKVSSAVDGGGGDDGDGAGGAGVQAGLPDDDAVLRGGRGPRPVLRVHREEPQALQDAQRLRAHAQGRRPLRPPQPRHLTPLPRSSSLPPPSSSFLPLPPPTLSCQDGGRRRCRTRTWCS